MLTPHSTQSPVDQPRIRQARSGGDRQHTAATIDRNGSEMLGRAYRRLTRKGAASQQVHEALDELFFALREYKFNSSDEQWQEFVKRCRQHPLRELLHDDPFTHRAYAKPRGYAGDAEMMDYIYGREERWAAPPSTPIGKHIFDYTTAAPASDGVRARRGFIANLVDNLCDGIARPRILSLAAGHLREAMITAAVRRGKIGSYVALDSDAQSLQNVERCFGCYGVQCIRARFAELVTGRLQLEPFDLIYSLGLLDYLGQATGRRLMQRTFQLLRPGGSLVVANFLPGIRDVGYMETFMDWTLVYRSRQAMVDLTGDIPDAQIDEIKIFAEENRNIVFLQVTKPR